jgi:sugar phosphate isomerase/epimerase
LNVCQLGGVAENLLFGKERAERIRDLKREIAARDITVTSVWIPFRNQKWGFYDAPNSIGMIPAATRAECMLRACMTSQLAAELGVDVIGAHVGFIPQEDGDFYRRFVEDMRHYLEYCQNLGQTFIFETGQEPVEVLERLFKDLDMPNIGLNFDTANLLIYNFDDPSVLVDKLGSKVINTHIKDGCRPTQPARLGTEAFFGEGDANIAELIRRLYREHKYTGPLIIEREIDGDQQLTDIRKTVKMLEEIRKELGVA